MLDALNRTGLRPVYTCTGNSSLTEGSSAKRRQNLRRILLRTNIVTGAASAACGETEQENQKAPHPPPRAQAGAAPTTAVALQPVHTKEPSGF